MLEKESGRVQATAATLGYEVEYQDPKCPFTGPLLAMARPIRYVVDPAGRDSVGYVAASGPDIETTLARVERALECCHIETTTTY